VPTLYCSWHKAPPSARDWTQ